jgi:hypothetical protein
MKLCDVVIAVLIAIIFVLAIQYQLGGYEDLELKNCVRKGLTDSELVTCIQNIKQ